jgi:hypothetical protein
MPYEGPLQGQRPTSFRALGPPAGIPHRVQMQYHPPANWYGNSPTAHSMAAPFSLFKHYEKVRELECVIFVRF